MAERIRQMIMRAISKMDDEEAKSFLEELVIELEIMLDGME